MFQGEKQGGFEVNYKLGKRPTMNSCNNINQSKKLFIDVFDGF